MSTLPKAAAALIADAQAAGHTVEVKTWGENNVDVNVTTQRGDHVFVCWSTKNTAGMNSRLGFATSYKAGVRFDYGNAHMTREVWDTRTGKQTTYPQVPSVRIARALLNLSV